MATKRILIIDDEAGFTNLVKLNLEQTRRFVVGVVNESVDAMAVAEEFKPQLILLDVMMPGKDGGELLAELEVNEQLKNVPVLFLTASTMNQLARAEQAAVQGRPVIAKPVLPQELIRRLDEVLGRELGKSFGLELLRDWGQATFRR